MSQNGKGDKTRDVNRAVKPSVFRSRHELTFKKTAKQRYDAKRQNDPQRKQKEAERTITRMLVRRGLLTKKGCCEKCKAFPVKTVFHHQAYKGKESPTIELCYCCHRLEHPRPLPHGGIK